MDDKQDSLRRDIIEFLKRHDIRVKPEELVALVESDPDFRFSPQQIQALCFAGSAFRIMNMTARARSARRQTAAGKIPPVSVTDAVQQSVINYLECNNLPVTRENYLAVAGYPDEPDIEQELKLPEQFRVLGAGSAAD